MPRDLDNYMVTMWTDHPDEPEFQRRHLVAFIMPAYSASEAIVKIRSMFHKTEIGGSVMRVPGNGPEVEF